MILKWLSIILVCLFEIGHCSISIESLTRLNRYLKTHTFFSNLTLNKHLVGTIRLEFSLDLINLLDKIQANKIQFLFRNYTDNKDYLFQTQADLTIQSNTSLVNFTDRFCLKPVEKNQVKLKCYNKISNNSDYNYLLESLVVRLKEPGNLIVCLRFLSDLFEDFYFYSENMCHDWLAQNEEFHHENHNFRYKPLFIVLMYLLCGSILLPIAIGQHFITKAKYKNMKFRMEQQCVSDNNPSASASQNLTEEKNRSYSSLRKNTSNIELQVPLIEKTPSATQVHFEIQSVENFNILDDNQDIQVEPEQTDVDHILNDKPWASKSCRSLTNIPKSTSSVDKCGTSMGSAVRMHTLGEQIAKPVSATNSNQSLSKRISLKKSTKSIFYESNV